MPPSSQRRATGSSRAKSVSAQVQKPKAKGQPASTQQVKSRAETGHQYDGLPFDVQQAILDVFARAFADGGGDKDGQRDIRCDTIKKNTQEVKTHLFNRDFAAAFSKPEYLDAYALRWSAARALAYAHIFTRPHRRMWFTAKADARASHSIHQHEAEILSTSTEEFSGPSPLGNSCHVVCVGGGAGAELAALAAALKQLCENEHSIIGGISAMSVMTVDVADWEAPLSRLYTSLTEPPPISPHASQAIKEANRPFLQDPSQFVLRVQKRDILPLYLAPDQEIEQPGSRSTSIAGQADEIRDPFISASLVTLMFTLNELFSQSIPKTTSFLLRLTDAMRPHSWLVVVDSPGSYSEIRLGKSGGLKKYPMRWLLDHTLLKVAAEDGNAKWEKVEDEESVWFRINEHNSRSEGDEGVEGGRSKKLTYPVDLENTRYQIHVYQRQPQ